MTHPNAPYLYRRLRRLDPYSLENLIFDLLVMQGATNVTWRTPGADGGRDIEGTTFETDLSGQQMPRRWFIECKRYKASVDWPTIYGKLAYADSLGADRLLLCTTAHFSPNALTHVQAWNADRHRVGIRLWPIHELVLQLERYPDLLLKYGLSSIPPVPGKSLLSIALASAKATSSHYSGSVFTGANIDPMLEASMALSELLLRRMEDLEQNGRIRPALGKNPSLSLGGCTLIGSGPCVDEPGLRAFVAYLTALAPGKVTIRARKRSCTITAPASMIEAVKRYREVFDSIAIWSDFEYTTSANEIYIGQRK